MSPPPSGQSLTPARVVRVHDGDTIVVDIDLQTRPVLGDALWAHEVTVRFAGCNAAELGAPGGWPAAANLMTLLPPGLPLLLHVTGADKYTGRRDARVYLADGTDLIADLIAANWLAAWDGRDPKPVPPWPRPPT